MILPVLVVPLLILGSNAQETSKPSFSCGQRPSGYYADLETGCQVYHMCDGLGRQFSYSCPNATLFQQRMLICDHWYMVNCSKSEVDYRANLLIGQRDKPFLEDSEKNPYYRTPRPDLLTNPKVSEYNLMYRNGRSQFASNFNLVGIETDNDNNSSFTTDQPFYSLPSHWFTEYSKTTPTRKHEEKVFHAKHNKYTKITNDTNKNIADKDYRIKLKSVINEITKFNFQNKVETSTEAFVTTFTRHYNNKLVVPSNTNAAISTRNNFSQPVDTQLHSLYAQTPDTKYANNEVHVRTILKKTLVEERRNNEMQWKDLRKLFLIPDYEFPLDSVLRPGYENGQSSFGVNSTLPDFNKK